jgi:hypothetical protein
MILYYILLTIYILQYCLQYGWFPYIHDSLYHISSIYHLYHLYIIYISSIYHISSLGREINYRARQVTRRPGLVRRERLLMDGCMFSCIHGNLNEPANSGGHHCWWDDCESLLCFSNQLWIRTTDMPKGWLGARLIMQFHQPVFTTVPTWGTQLNCSDLHLLKQTPGTFAAMCTFLAAWISLLWTYISASSAVGAVLILAARWCEVFGASFTLLAWVYSSLQDCP